MLIYRHLGSQLVELEKLIDKMLQDEFSRFIAADLHRPIDDRTLPQEVCVNSRCIRGGGDMHRLTNRLAENKQSMRVLRD